MKQIKTFQYKLKPTKEQEQRLEQWLGTCRYIYNLALEYKITLWRHYRISISKFDMQKELTRLAREVDWIGSVNAQARQAVIERMYCSYKRFFRHNSGYPKFARKGHYNSIVFWQGIKLEPGTIYLPKFGAVKYYENQTCDTPVKTASVKKLVDGWHVFVVAEVDIEPLPMNENKIGIDVGIKSLITTSTGEVVINPKHLFKNENKLKRLQRSVSRKKKGSNNRKKAITKLARQHRKVANCRKDFQHKLTTRLIRENQTIVVEKIKVVNLVKNHKLANAISDAAWGQLIEMLTYKAIWYGRELIKVPAAYTSMTCSSCGFINQNLTLSDRDWICPDCGTNHNRDINAAVNIANKAVV